MNDTDSNRENTGMATIAIQDDTAADRAYYALKKAGERIGFNNWRAGLAHHLRAGRKASTYRYIPTEEHRRIVAALSAVLKGDVSPEQAMAMLHEYEVLEQRLAK